MLAIFLAAGVDLYKSLRAMSTSRLISLAVAAIATWGNDTVRAKKAMQHAAMIDHDDFAVYEADQPDHPDDNCQAYSHEGVDRTLRQPVYELLKEEHASTAFRHLGACGPHNMSYAARQAFIYPSMG